MSHEQKKVTNLSINKNQTPWFSTEELLEYLGISNNELSEQMGLLKEGVHYQYQQSTNGKQSILWRVDLIDEILCLQIPPLEKEAMLNAINNHITCHE